MSERILTPRYVLLLLLMVVVVPLLPMLVSGRWAWWEAWAFALTWIGALVISRALVATRHPDLLAERASSLDREDTKAFDKVLSPLMGLGGAAVPLVAGLEARYGEPRSFPIAIKLAALGVMLAGYALSSWALYENRFFSAVVRIQTDRGHHVIDTGPYRVVRHPGYAGALLAWLPAPLLLESPWTWVPVVLLAAIAVIRVVFEERTLCEELPGYREFTSRTRARLLPGVW